MSPTDRAAVYPKNHFTELPMSYSIAAPLKALTQWKGHSLKLLSTEIRDRKPKSLSKWKGLVVREGAISTLAGLTLASPYFTKSNQTLAFLQKGKACVAVVLATVSIIAVREILFDASCLRTQKATESYNLNSKIKKELSEEEYNYVELMIGNKRESPEVMAELLLGIFSGKIEGVTQEDFINSDFCFNRYLHLISHFFSNMNNRAELAEKDDASVINCSHFINFRKVSVKIVLLQKDLFDSSDLELASPTLEGFDELILPYQNMLLLLEVLHKELIKFGFSIYCQEQKKPLGISEYFYYDISKEIFGLNYLPTYEEFLELITPTAK